MRSLLQSTAIFNILKLFDGIWTSRNSSALLSNTTICTKTDTVESQNKVLHPVLTWCLFRPQNRWRHTLLFERSIFSLKRPSFVDMKSRYLNNHRLYSHITAATAHCLLCSPPGWTVLWGPLAASPAPLASKRFSAPIFECFCITDCNHLWFYLVFLSLLSLQTAVQRICSDIIFFW